MSSKPCPQRDAVLAMIAPLFSQGNLAEIAYPDFPGERLVACFNPLLAMDYAHAREDLLACTEEQLKTLAAQVAGRTGKPLPVSGPTSCCACWRTMSNGTCARRWDGLLSALSTLARNTCHAGEGKTAVRFTRATEPDALRSKVFELLQQDGPSWTGECAQ